MGSSSTALLHLTGLLWAVRGPLRATMVPICIGEVPDYGQHTAGAPLAGVRLTNEDHEPITVDLLFDPILVFRPQVTGDMATNPLRSQITGTPLPTYPSHSQSFQVPYT